MRSAPICWQSFARTLLLAVFGMSCLPRAALQVTTDRSAYRAGDTVAVAVCNHSSERLLLAERSVELQMDTPSAQTIATAASRDRVLPPRNCSALAIELSEAVPLTKARLVVRRKHGAEQVLTKGPTLRIYGEKLPSGVEVAKLWRPWLDGRDPLKPYDALDAACPGFSGLQVQDGRLSIVLTSTGDAACVRRVAAQMRQQGAGLPGLDDASVVRARYSFRELFSWYPVVVSGGGWSTAAVEHGSIDLTACAADDVEHIEEWLEVIPVPRDAVRIARGCLGRGRER